MNQALLLSFFIQPQCDLKRATFRMTWGYKQDILLPAFMWFPYGESGAAPTIANGQITQVDETVYWNGVTT